MKRRKRLGMLLFLSLSIFLSYHAIGWVVSWFHHEPLAKPALGPAYASEETAAQVTVIVNREHPLPAAYVPQDLTAPDIPFIFEGQHEKRLLRAPAARAAEKLFAAAARDGLKLYGVSGYRSYETQKALFAFNVRSKGESHAARYSATPGASEHQTGLALDVTSAAAEFQLLPSFAHTAEGEWLARHSHQFGFIIRYPEGKEAITGIAYEPWHIRFVGQETAKSAYSRGLTLEELSNSALPVLSKVFNISQLPNVW